MSNEPQQPDAPRQPDAPQQPDPSPRSGRSQRESGGAPDSDQRLPEIVDAEIVETASTEQAEESSRRTGLPERPSGAEDEEFRQYQQFLEFQRFQEWQRKYGDAAPPTAPGGPMPESVRESWWKRALWQAGAKILRRVIYLIALVLLAVLAFNWFLGGLLGGGGSDSDDGEQRPGDPPPPQPQVRQSDPEQAIIAVFDYLATDDYERIDPQRPPVVCLLFTPSARSAFASVHDAPDCGTAAKRLHQQVTEPMAYKNPRFGENAVQEVYNPKFGGSENTPNDAVARSCHIAAAGGPELGDFGLRRDENGGWIIDSYAPASDCR